jgi:hypothetical protein
MTAVDPEDGGTEASTKTYETFAVDTAFPIAGAKSPALLCVTMTMTSPRHPVHLIGNTLRDERSRRRLVGSHLD